MFTLFRSLSFVYPYGATLTVQKPAIAVLSSGSTSYPVNRPICAFCRSKVMVLSSLSCCTYFMNVGVQTQNGQGKLVVIGSTHVFSDQYLDKEENNKLQEVIFRWLTSDEISLNPIDAEDPEVRNGGRSFKLCARSHGFDSLSLLCVINFYLCICYRLIHNLRPAIIHTV